MIIKEIEFNNFRIYKGKNRICLTPEDGKNIIVVSGNNGFGKTTFLMALVWCLYGKQMEKVDELYKREVLLKFWYIYVSKFEETFICKREIDALPPIIRFAVFILLTEPSRIPLFNLLAIELLMAE